MKLPHSITALALAALLTGCGNEGWLSSLNGSSDGETLSAQDQAIEDLAESWCGECHAPDGGAEHVFANVTPEEYAGGPLELALVIGNPGGVVDENGDWIVEVMFRINAFDLFAALPREAWLISPDRTMARVVLLAEAGLPAGTYVVKGAIVVPPPPEEAFLPGGAAADDMETYEVPGHDDDGEHGEGGGEHGDGEGDGEHGEGDGEGEGETGGETGGETDPV